MSNFHPLEVVGRCSETQVVENVNKITYRALISRIMAFTRK